MPDTLHLMLRALKRLVRAPRRLLLRGDTLARIHGVTLVLPRDHGLPGYVKRFPDYSTNVVRVASAVTGKYTGSPCVDVGANVGDTTNFLRKSISSPILAVEGDPFWLPYLEINTRGLPEIVLARAFIGVESGPFALRPTRLRGTSRFAADVGSVAALQVSTARDLIDRFPEFRASRFIKTDTDGFDYEVLVSFLSAGLIHAPVFFFEHDPHIRRGGFSESVRARSALLEHGYEHALWWDNFGRFLLAADLGDEALWENLSAYVPAPASVYYWDIAVFSHTDLDIAESLRRGELARHAGLKGQDSDEPH